MNRTQLVTGKVFGFTDPEDVQKTLGFFSLQANTCKSFREDNDMNSGMARCSKQIGARSAYEVWLEAQAGNADSCLELGLRMYAGCGASQDREAALDWWSRISDPTHPNYIKTARRPTKARALSCLANDYFDKSNLPDQTLQIDDLYRAAYLANASASWGHISPIVLAIGARVEKIGLRRQAECHFEGVDTSRFEALEFLWKAADARSEELNKKHQKRDTKVSQAPNLYICAAEGCGIEGTRRSGLLKCSGKCTLDVKPSYCSKECQKADWKRHRMDCIGAKADSSETTSTAPPPKKTNETIGEHMRHDGRELNIDMPMPNIPGGKVQLSSTTISASFMKELRDLAVDHAARQ